jgi:hypothetical protein
MCVSPTRRPDTHRWTFSTRRAHDRRAVSTSRSMVVHVDRAVTFVVIADKSSDKERTFIAGDTYNVTWAMSYPHATGYKLALLGPTGQRLAWLAGAETEWAGTNDYRCTGTTVAMVQHCAASVRPSCVCPCSLVPTAQYNYYVRQANGGPTTYFSPAPT